MPPHEDQDLFRELRAELTEEFDPTSALELMLVERLAILFWRERRLATAEAHQLEDQHAMANNPYTREGSSQPIADQYLVGRYQGMLGRQIRDTLRDLHQARARQISPIGMRGDEDQWLAEDET